MCSTQPSHTHGETPIKRSLYGVAMKHSLIHLHAMDMQTPEIPSRASQVDVSLQTRSREAKYFMQDCRKIHEESTKVLLKDFIRAALELDTTDPRDRLFGGYGIIDRSIMQRIPVDPGISAQTLSQ